jgi:RNA polymerase sigma-32 factor
LSKDKLADEFGVSRERVRQIEARAFEKVQKAVRNRLATMETPTVPLGCQATPSDGRAYV